jgi:pimeloyl-ACP methyl ester carboxylesterase
VAVIVHGLGCNEGCFRFPGGSEDYGSLLAKEKGFLPLYLRYNTGRRVSQNGADLARLLDETWQACGDGVDELVLIGHSMGGLVLRSACHQGGDRPWTKAVRHAFYLGSPHLGAPLERFANVAAAVLGRVPTTATRVIGDVLKSRSAGVKDLRYGNLTDADWLDLDPDALLADRRVVVPWLPGARHHRVVGHLVPAAPFVGDGMVTPESGSAGQADVTVMPGLDHLALARHPKVYAFIAEQL